MATAEGDYLLVTTVQDSHADIVVVCPSDDRPSAEVAFRLQKKNLEAHSSVFSDMLASAHIGEKWQGLPVVKLVEPCSILQTVFAVVCNLAEQPAGNRFDDWDGACAVWEAAQKYGMHAIRYLAEASIISQIPEEHMKPVIELQVRARELQDHHLAMKLLSVLKNKKVLCGDLCPSSCGNQCRLAMQTMSKEDRSDLLWHKMSKHLSEISVLASQAFNAILPVYGSPKLEACETAIYAIHSVVNMAERLKKLLE